MDKEMGKTKEKGQIPMIPMGTEDTDDRHKGSSQKS